MQAHLDNRSLDGEMLKFQNGVAQSYTSSDRICHRYQEKAMPELVTCEI